MQWLHGLKSQQGSLDWEPVSEVFSLTFFADAMTLLPCLPAADASVWRWPTSSAFCWRAWALETKASGQIIDVAMLALTGTRTATKQRSQKPMSFMRSQRRSARIEAKADDMVYLGSSPAWIDFRGHS